MSQTALTPKQKIFADEYLINLNATRVHKVAYPSCKKDGAAVVNGSKLLRNTKVVEHIQERMKDWEECTEITQDWVLEELRKTASANGTDLAHAAWEPVIRNNSYVANSDADQMQTGDMVQIIPTEELPEEKRAAISVTKETKFGIGVKTYDRVRVLEFLGRHLGMFRDKVELPGGLNIEKTKLDDLLQQMCDGG